MDTDIGALTVIFTEFYYWVTVPLMFLIHVGFCMYEVGATRRKNHLHTLMKNTMLIPLVTITFFFFGWWIYFAFPNGPGITGGLIQSDNAFPWSELMGTHLGGPGVASSDPVMGYGVELGNAYWARVNGVFWAAFLLFSWTAASIVSGAVIERIRPGAFWIIAVLVGSFTWIIDAAWGWHPDGWMVTQLGYHDAYASGVIHAIAGGAALGVLIPLGPRLGKFAPDGTPRNINPHNKWLVTIGLFLIYTGFWGFYVACNVPIIDYGALGGAEGVVNFTATTIYLTPTTLSAIVFNFLMSLSGGLIAGYVVSRGESFWTYSCGLAGVICASAGNDLYHPIQAMLIGAVGAVCAYKLHFWVENKFKIDDAVGAVAVHGYAGFIGLVIAGFMLWGHPATAGYYDPATLITPWGQFAGAIIMFVVLGFIPAYVVSNILKSFGVLRIPPAVELVGLDISEEMAEEMDAIEVSEADIAEAKRLGLLA
ncbi:MAG TPA: ammonium transporter [Thermohalobaculum sp.]|nr:ammonium transporter [Thermohalobaculum sp.]